MMLEDYSDKESSQEKTVIQKIRLAFWTLKFTGEYKEFEKHFLASFYHYSLNKVRFAILTAVVIYAFFGILDAALIPDYTNKFWTIRYLIVIPLLLGVLALSFTRIFKKKIQFISASVALFSGLGVIVIIYLAPPNLSNYYFPGLILILVMSYGFMRLRFVWSAFVGIPITTFYIVAAFDYIEMPYLLCVFNSFFLIAINIVGFMVSREFEIYARKEYFANQLLKIERMKLKSLNTRLEAKIKEKSQQFTHLQNEILTDDVETKD
jgi:hypothetical protein